VRAPRSPGGRFGQRPPGAFAKLDPRSQWRNPVMFIVWVGAILTTVLAIAEPFIGGPAPRGITDCP